MNNPNTMVQASGGDYAPKMDNTLTKAISDWWNSLTKDEILEYLKEQPDLTADTLRNMLANMNVKLAFGISFSAATQQAVTDFYREERN